MSFAGWVDDFEAVDVPSDLGGLDQALFVSDRLMAKTALSVAEMDAAGLWQIDGAPSAAGWLRRRGLTTQEAHRLVMIGRKLLRLPVLAGAWLSGDLNGGQVQAINMHVPSRHMDLFASHEAELVPSFKGLTVEETARAMSLWRTRADALDEGPAPRDAMCEATLSRTMDDRGRLTADLDAEGVALATAALDLADTHNLDTPAMRRRGQALKDVFRWFLDHQDISTPPRKRPHVNIVVREETIHTNDIVGYDVESGVRIESGVLRRYMCDCEFHRLILGGDGVPLDYGRAIKDPPIELYNAVVARDQQCRGHGCDRPASWCHVHHVKWWERDRGITAINNLVLLCARCHGVVHRKGWSAVLHPDGRFDVTTPWGEIRTTYPPGHRTEPDLDWDSAARPHIWDKPNEPYIYDDPYDRIHNSAAARARIDALKQLAAA